MDASAVLTNASCLAEMSGAVVTTKFPLVVGWTLESWTIWPSFVNLALSLGVGSLIIGVGRMGVCP